jgi:hypothetical protein
MPHSLRVKVDHKTKLFICGKEQFGGLTSLIEKP